MTVSLVEILAAARAYVAPLAAESAGYLMLAVADHVVSAPRIVDPSDVELGGDGVVRLRARRGAAESTGGAEQNVRRLLARALEVSSSVGPGLRRAADRREDTGLPALVRELEVALIPVNRSAAKRALSRLHRETERARDAGKLESLLRAEEAAPVPLAAPVEAADLAEPSPAPLPAVRVAEPSARPAVRTSPVVELTLTPEPQMAVGEPALTKPEPVVLRARERGSSTPQLGTVVTAQTLPGEEQDRTERAPEVELEDALAIDIELSPVPSDVADEPTPALPRKLAVAEPATPQPWSDPEPSRMPDVLTAMRDLHAEFDGDEAPTRLRVVTELLPPAELFVVEAAPIVQQEASAAAPLVTPEPEHVEDAWLTASSLEGVVIAPIYFESERAAPEVHDAVTWNPGPVVSKVSAPLPAALLISEPALEPSPYAPAVLPALSSDVSELLDSFHVSGAAEEQELRSALKEMAGLELTPMPHPLVRADER